MADKLQQLREIAQVAYKDYATVSDVTRLFDVFLNRFKSIREGLEQNVAKIKAEMVSETKDITQKAVAQFTTKIESFEKTVREVREASRSDSRSTMRYFDEKVNELRRAIPDEVNLAPLERKIEEVRAMIPVIPDIPEAPDVDTPVSELRDEVIEKLEELKRQLEDRIEAVRAARVGGSMGMRKITSTRSYNLTSQTDGVTKSFTLPNDTLKVLGVWGTQFPITFDADNDFTFSGRTLTLTDEVSAPASGQTLWCLIETQFYAK